MRHLMIGVANLSRSKDFYDAVLGSLGYALAHGNDNYAMWVPDGGGCGFGIRQSPPEKVTHRHDRGAPGWDHLAINADSREVIDDLYSDVLVATGAVVLDPPQECPEYSETYYACYFEDPDGLKLEAVHS